jgi:integrase
MTTTNGRLVARILAAVAEWESETIGDRVKDGMAQAKAEGARFGKGRMTDAATVGRIRQLRAEGLSFAGIASILDKQGVPTPNGGQRWYTSTVSRLYSASTKVALTSKNPCSGTPLPTPSADEEFEARILTGAEVESLASELDEHAPYGLLVRFAAYTGLRAGELAGLRVRDVNMLRGHIEVRQTLLRTKGGWTFGTPKSKRSSRDVPILRSSLLEALGGYLDAHPRRHDPDAPLWPGRRVGTHALDFDRPFDHQSFYRWYFRRYAPTGVRFHDLRHTAASLWLAAGLPPYKVSRWLGHASLTTTDTVYGHLYPSDYGHEMAALDAHLLAETGLGTGTAAMAASLRPGIAPVG